MAAIMGLLPMLLLLGNTLAEETDESEETPESRSEWGREYGDYNFAGELFNRVGDILADDQDFVVSPLGVSQALGLLLFAVGPQSAVEIDGVLYPKTENATGLAPRHLLQSGELTYATVAALRPDIYIDPGFLKEAAELDSYVYRTHFGQRDIKPFNAFLKHKTQGKINVGLEKSLGDYNPANRLLFFNVLDFKAQFRYGFHIEKRVLVARRTLAWHGFIPELRTRVVALGLKESSADLLILLPMRKASIYMVERKLRTVDVRKLRSRLNITLMNISLPKVDISQLLNLREPLRKAGMTTVFNKTTADLSAFKTELPLDDVIAFTKINIFSQGINAGSENTTNSEQSAQLEADSFRASVQEEKPLQFEALRPFIYAVLDSRHVYLMGRHFPTL
ncbi:serpin B6-like [Drosophila takahashii]|uniref:serpin B6-like n=1 Tax=Drosophila takahashii TaxID=29030 RepID=UPI001CF8F38E|nr:serpin I2-like [Drosophila takahashii]